MEKILSGGKPHTIGLLINQLECKYQQLLCRAANEISRELGFNFVWFVGKPLESPYGYESQHNVIYQLTGMKNIEGIIADGVIMNFIPKEKLAQLVDFIKPLPMVSLNLPILDLPHVLADNKIGLSNAIEHLVRDHKYRRIAFIKGLNEHWECQQRYQAYQEVLAKYGIPEDPELVVSGNLVFDTGVRAVRMLVEDRNVRFDAIVAANDDMALGAIEELKAMGYRIPGDVAVVGFDDLEESQVMEPPMTTVRQPIKEMVREAAIQLIAMIEGREVEAAVMIPTEAVIRQSCGCTQEPALNENQSGILQESSFAELGNDLRVLKLSVTRRVFDTIELSNSIRDKFKGWISSLVDAFYQDIGNGFKENSFLIALQEVLSLSTREAFDFKYWQKVVYILQSACMEVIQDLTVQKHCSDLFQKAQIAVGDVMARGEICNRLKVVERALIQQEIGQTLVSTLEVPKLIEIMGHEIPRLDIESCYIVLYQGKVLRHHALRWQVPEWSDLIFAYHKGQNIDLAVHKTIFSTKSVLPAEFIQDHDCFTMVVMPLFHRMEHFGYIVFNLGERIDITYENLRSQISSALYAARLFQARETAEDELKVYVNMLKHSEERFKKMAEMLPTILIETDKNLKILFINQAGFEAFDIKESDMGQNQTLYQFVHPQDEQKLKAFSLDIMQGKSLPFQEIQFRKKGFLKFAMLLKATPIIQNEQVEGLRINAINMKPLMFTSAMTEESYFQRFKFSPREQQVLSMILQGYKTKEIAKKLFIAESTVKDYMSIIYNKVNVKSKIELFESLEKHQINKFGYESFIFSVISRFLKE